MKAISPTEKRLGLYYYLLKAYPKYLSTGRVLDFPLSIQIQTQSFCNGRCSICPYRITSKKLDQGTMEWDLYQKIINEAASEPLLFSVLYELHNEPLLDRRIFDCVKYLKSKNMNKRCGLVTNGMLLDRFSLTDIAQSNLDTLIISLNAHSRKVYESTNIGLDYDRVMKNIDDLLSNKAIRPKLALSFVVTQYNEQDVHEAIKCWRQRGVRTRIIKEIANRAGTLDNYDELKLNTASHLKLFSPRPGERLMDIASRIVGCHLPFYKICILYNGDVIICCHDWERATVVGNVASSSLREVWNSARMNKIRRLILLKKYEHIDSCRGCSLARH